MTTCPTIRVASDASPDGYRLINESDFDPAVHVLVDAGDLARLLSRPAPERQNVEDPFADVTSLSPPLDGDGSGEALPEIARDPLDHDGDGERGGSLPAPDPKPAGAEIPDNWADLHWTQRVHLAQQLGAEGKPSAAEASVYIEGVIAARSAASIAEA